MTRLVLALGAMMDTCTDADLQEALEETPQKKVDNWVGRVLGPSMQWVRKQFLGHTKA